jgi:myosin-5
VCGELTTPPNEQSKTVETTQDELQLDNNPNLPPLMNPAMLEASEDLTNLSHLNEPAGLSPSGPTMTVG